MCRCSAIFATGHHDGKGPLFCNDYNMHCTYKFLYISLADVWPWAFETILHKAPVSTNK